MKCTGQFSDVQARNYFAGFASAFSGDFSGAGAFAAGPAMPNSAAYALLLNLTDKDDVLVHPGFFFDFATESFLIVNRPIVCYRGKFNHP